MAEMPDCRSARAALRRIVTGAPIAEVEAERALAHVATCARCSAPFAHVEPAELFQRALTGALSGPDPTVRERAADRLGGFDRLGPAALAALADAAAEDRTRRVRAAAVAALDKLDAAVSLPRRVVEAWSAAPAEAAPFIAGVLARLAGEGPPAAPGVTQLVASTGGGVAPLAVTGQEGISGNVTEKRSKLWLTLESLPASFESTRPVVALPLALEKDAPPIKWPGREPGLVPARRPVADGVLKVRLGDIVEPHTGLAPVAVPAEGERLFAQMYLLSL